MLVVLTSATGTLFHAEEGTASTHPRTIKYQGRNHANFWVIARFCRKTMLPLKCQLTTAVYVQSRHVARPETPRTPRSAENLYKRRGKCCPGSTDYCPPTNQPVWKEGSPRELNSGPPTQSWKSVPTKPYLPPWDVNLTYQIDKENNNSKWSNALAKKPTLALPFLKSWESQRRS